MDGKVEKPALRPAARRTQQPSVRADLQRIADAGRPWWAEAPDVAEKCLSLAFAPFRLAVLAAEAAVSLCFVAAFGSVALWWLGYIPDALVASALGEVGNRMLAILQSSGIL